MRLLTRTIVVLVIFNLTTGNPALAQDVFKPREMTISGSAGLPGVTMKGLPGTPITATNGSYSATVPRGWTGTVSPMKAGYAFTPEFKEYSALTSDLRTENYVPEIIKLTILGNARTEGVEMKGLPGNPTTDKAGYYRATVDYGWSGTVTPVKEGVVFEPSSIRYVKLTSSQGNQDYTPATITYTISGTTGTGGTEMRGLPGRVFTDQRGYYSVAVPYGWAGRVEPVKEDYEFEPPGLIYNRVTNSFTGQNYTAKSKSSDAASSDPYGDFGSSRARSGRRGSGRGMEMMYEPSPSPPRGRSSSGYRPAIRSGGRKVLVIPASEVEPEELAQTIEDMHVMSHILDEGFKQTRRIQGFFTDFGDFFGRDSRGTEATYLEGFGVLFLMEVNFAFSPPPKEQAQDPTETAEAVDSAWQKARRQVLSPGASPGMNEEGPSRDYDNQMVEELKRELVKALKQATNIRNVKPDEWIILTVLGGQRQFGMGFGGGLPMGGGMSTFGGSARTGGSSGAGGGMAGGMGGYGGGFSFGSSGQMMGGGMYGGGMGGMMGGGMAGGMYGEMGAFGGANFSPSTVLTIRARKSDVDDFAKAELDFEQFQQKVTILTY